MTKVKICGITNVEDARVSASAGADMLGFNFFERSPRFISPDAAREIVETVNGDVERVGVFVNATAGTVAETVSRARLSAVQLHGDEPPTFIRELRDLIDCEVIKAFRVTDGFAAEKVLDWGADAILLDAFSARVHGGTGSTFEWDIARRLSPGVRLYLAGGLSAENVADAIARTQPYAVDACSLIESRPGKKDPEKVRRFLLEAKRND